MFVRRLVGDHRLILQITHELGSQSAQQISNNLEILILKGAVHSFVQVTPFQRFRSHVFIVLDQSIADEVTKNICQHYVFFYLMESSVVTANKI